MVTGVREKLIEVRLIEVETECCVGVHRVEGERGVGLIVIFCGI